MKSKLFPSIAIAAAILVACSNDDTQVTGVISDSRYISILDNSNEIAQCSDENEGTTYFVTDSSAFLRCNSGKWITIHTGDNEIPRIDTVYMITKDSSRIDTVYMIAKDSSRIDTVYMIAKDSSRIDTVYMIAKDSSRIDTIYSIDTVYSIDSIFVRDTVQGLDGKDGTSCSATDTTAVDGTKGYNIDCGNKRVGTLWNGKNGLSAYEIAVQNGFEGSEQDWLNLITQPEISSSSEEPASSSSKQNWDFLNSDKTYGLFTDTRDSNVYKTIVIGGKTWFAENLNYKILSSYCYDGENEACNLYGRLYPHGQAKTACPPGWHLPSKDEYMSMYKEASNNYSNIVSKHNGGNNSSGFSLLYAGARLSDGAFKNLDSYAYLWTSTMGSEGPIAIGPFVVGNNFYAIQYSASTAFSVRCVMD